MAEISQTDIQRAVQTYTQPLRNEIARLSQQIQLIPEIQQSVHAVRSEVQKVTYSQSQTANMEKRIYDLVSEIQELRQRLISVEYYCSLIYKQTGDGEEEGKDEGRKD